MIVKNWLVLVMCLAVSACGGENEEDKKSYSFPVLDNHPIFFEACKTPKQQIALRLCTQELYSCYNYHIMHTASISDENVAIRLLGAKLHPDGGCLTSIGPAFAESFLNLPTGSYTLSFSKRLKGSNKWTQDKDSYHLSVTEESTAIAPVSGRFTRAVFQCNTPKSFFRSCKTRGRWISKNRKEYEQLKVQAAKGSLQAAIQLRDHAGEVEHLWQLASGGSAEAQAELNK